MDRGSSIRESGVSESKWYYLDSDRKQNGPVTADVIRNALREGRVVDTTLVWRDGLANWLPIRQLASELGISPAPASPPSPDNIAANVDVGPGYPPPDDQRTRVRAAAADVVPAGFIRRWAALFLDSLILGIPLAIVAGIVAIPLGLFSAGRGDAAGSMAQGVYYLFYLIVAPLYYAGMESSVHQATLGKRALGIKVTDDEGRRISFGHALGRWFAASLSYLTLYIGFLMAAFTERKRALHDMVAGTLVVDQWAYTDFPERQKRELSGCLIAFLVGMLVVPFFVAVLAAITISQYQDYVIRAQVSEGVALADGVKTAVSNSRDNSDALPTNNASAGLAAPTSITGSYVSRVDVGSTPGEITTTFSSNSPQRANRQLDGKSLVFSPTENHGVIEWRCHSDNLRRKWCPRSCECQ
jgi:uncharacterized RDD family membrane protein YckC/Tfp pilus assembly major pilin PilA